MMGRDKVLTTTTPERQVWGPYNLKMGTASMNKLGKTPITAQLYSTSHGTFYGYDLVVHFTARLPCCCCA